MLTSTRTRSRARRFLVLAAWLLAGGCSDPQAPAPSAPDVPAPVLVASITVSPSDLALEPGDTVRLTATPKDAFGNALKDRAVTWSSSDTAVAIVSPSGWVTGVGLGAATVAASVEGQQGTASVMVEDPASHGPVSSLASGAWHACALREDGAAYCWGLNDYGQLGSGNQLSNATSVRVAGGLRFTQLAAGERHTCGIAIDQRVWCWGANHGGQLGIREWPALCDPDDWFGEWSGCSLVPVEVSDFQAHRLVASGEFAYGFTCATGSQGGAYCWGVNTLGELGIGTIPPWDSPKPTRVVGPGLVSLAAGGDHGCGLDDEGAAWCWGTNEFGQLGTDSSLWSCPDKSGPPCAAAPVEVQGGLTFRELAASVSQTCGLTPDGSVYCWGANALGSSAVPERLGGDHVFVALSRGSQSGHLCGVEQGGEALCWGRNDSGQLGDGTHAGSWAPVHAMSGQQFVELAAGASHTCGLTTDRSIVCWGQGLVVSATPIR